MIESSTGTGASLVFLETRGQVRKVRHLLRRTRAPGKVVALSPEAMDSLDRMHLPYTTPEDYCSVEAIREMGEQNFARTERLCNDIDDYLRLKLSTQLDSPAPQMARMHFYDLKILTDVVGTRVSIIGRVLEGEKPSKVLFFRTRPQRPGEDFDFDHESVYSLVIPLVCGSVGTPFTVLGTEKVSFPSVDTALWKRLIYTLVGRKMVARARLALAISPRLTRGRSKAKGRPRVLLINANPELLEVVRHCQQRKQYDFVTSQGWLKGKTSPAEPGQTGMGLAKGLTPDARALWEDKKAQEQWRAHFVFDGLDCWPVVEGRIRRLITRSLPVTFATWLRARVRFGVDPCVSVLLSTFLSAQERAIAAAARETGVPVLLYQHGGGYGWRRLPMHFYLEGRFMDYFAAYGEGAARHFARTAPPGSSQPRTFSVGSCSLDRLAERLQSPEGKGEVHAKYGLEPGKRLVLYVVDVFGGSRGYYPNYYPDTWYYAHQKDMAAVLARHPEFQCLVKLPSGNNAQNPLGGYIGRLGADHIRVADTGRFSDLLPAADAVIIDYPSTTLLEALVTGKPVLVLVDSRVLAFDESAMKLLRKRARVASTPQELMELVQGFLGNGMPHDDFSADNEFLREYGTHLGDGLSLERAAARLHQLASERSLMSEAAGSESGREAEAPQNRYPRMGA